MHSKHGTTIICADHTKWSHQIQRYDNSLSKLGLIPTFNSLVKKKQKTFICDTFEYDTMAMKFLVRFLRVLSTSYLMHYGLLSIWGWEGACPQNNSNWQLGVLKNKTKWGQIFYSITYLIDVGAILYLLTKNLFLKVAWERSDHQDLKVHWPQYISMIK